MIIRNCCNLYVMWIRQITQFTIRCNTTTLLLQSWGISLLWKKTFIEKNVLKKVGSLVYKHFLSIQQRETNRCFEYDSTCFVNILCGRWLFKIFRMTLKFRFSIKAERTDLKHLDVLCRFSDSLKLLLTFICRKFYFNSSQLFFSCD
jgi:hypothetical protein